MSNPTYTVNGDLTSNIGTFSSNNDYVWVTGVARADAKVNLGEGDNTLAIEKSVYIHGDHAFAFGSGNDTFNIGINLDGKNTINMGEGDNQLVIGASKKYTYDGYIGANSQSTISFGSGNDTMSVRTNIDGKNTLK